MQSPEGLEIAESLLEHGTLVGTVETGRFGLGVVPEVQYNEAQSRDKCHIVPGGGTG